MGAHQMVARCSEREMARVVVLGLLAAAVCVSAAPAYTPLHFGFEEEGNVLFDSEPELEFHVPPPGSEEITGEDLLIQVSPKATKKAVKKLPKKKLTRGKSVKPVKKGNLYANCMTTKAYAMAKADYIVEQTSRNLGVVKEFLIELAKSGDCVNQFHQWSKMAMLNYDAKDSINKHLARLIRYRMIHRHGILTWHHNTVYVSGRKIGLTGDVDLLARGNLVATSFEVQRLIYKLGAHNHIVIEGKVQPIPHKTKKAKNPYTRKDANKLLKGECFGAVSLYCGGYTKSGRRVCLTTGCQWRGPWNGREVAATQP